VNPKEKREQEVKERKKTKSALRAIGRPAISMRTRAADDLPADDFMRAIFEVDQEKACVRPAGDLIKNQSCVASLRRRLGAWAA